MTLPFSTFEQAALAAILEEQRHHPNLALTLVGASVAGRDNSGGGFFTTILPGRDAVPTSGERHFGHNVFARIEGMHFGIGLILHLEHGYPNWLEGFSLAGEATEGIDFLTASFEIYFGPT